jgi:hypothetical protein
MKLLKPPHLILLTIAIFVIGVVGWVVYVNKVVSYPLGDRLEYVGKRDFGCYGLCDSAPTSTYYYATDMTVEEVEGYFRGARLVQLYQPDKYQVYTTFYFDNDNYDFNIHYYPTLSDIGEEINLNHSDKKHYIGLAKSKYDTAKKSL